MRGILYGILAGLLCPMFVIAFFEGIVHAEPDWWSLRDCESTNRYYIVSSNGMYFGAYQFDLQTWESVGGTGLPSEASPEEQDYRAWLLYLDRGCAPWKACCVD